MEMTDGPPDDVMAREMLQYAGFQDGVNARLRKIAQRGYCVTEKERRSLIDLYEIYGQQDITDARD